MTDRKGVFLKPKEGRSYPMGAMSQPASHHLFVDELKLDRPTDLFNRGYT